MTDARQPTRTASRIADQLAARLDGHATSDEAFVVSIYGEWGIGKTRCLRDIETLFALRLDAAFASADAAPPADFVVPVFFDPWQYEHEEHLVVPLMKTIELTLERAAARAEAAQLAARGTVATMAGGVVAVAQAARKAGGVFGDVAVALLSGFKFKFAPLKEVIGFEAEFAPKDAFEASRKAAELRGAGGERLPLDAARRLVAEVQPRAPAAEAALKRLGARESLYFDARGALEALTRRALDRPALRLVVLIDDLDRCLPEKAVQVLESVKLFLNVPGFSFVLAVDDEIVERGVAHRYRDYLAVGAGGLQAPISGAEYLEKIVHLPVHLPRWTEGEAADFLRATWPALFTAPGGSDAAVLRTAELVELMLRAVPLVPRKLIRLAEALEFQWRHFEALNTTGLWHALHAARLIALQQLYPRLYRHLRLRDNRYWRMFELKRDAYGEPVLANGESLNDLRWQFDVRRRDGQLPARPEAAAPSSPPSAPSAAIADTQREQLTLLELIDEAAQQRGNPDPLQLFAPGPRGFAPRDRQPEGISLRLKSYKDFARLYLHGLPPDIDPLTMALEPRRIAELADADRDALMDRLLNADTPGRREFLQQHPLDGRLPDDFLDDLLRRVDADRRADADWLADLWALTSADQQARLISTP